MGHKLWTISIEILNYFPETEMGRSRVSPFIGMVNISMISCSSVRTLIFNLAATLPINFGQKVNVKSIFSWGFKTPPSSGIKLKSFLSYFRD